MLYLDVHYNREKRQLQFAFHVEFKSRFQKANTFIVIEYITFLIFF